MAKPTIKILEAEVVLDKLPDFDHNAIWYVYSVDGTQIRGGHWSGRFNGQVHELATHIHDVLVMNQLNYLTTTETEQKGALEAIEAELEGTSYTALQVGEYVLIYDHSVFSPLPNTLPRQAVFTNVLHWAKWRQMHVSFFNLYHMKLKRRLRLLDIHGPAGIEYGNGPKLGKQWLIARFGWPKVGRDLKRFAKNHPGAIQVVHADSNGDHHQPFWLSFFQRMLGAKSIWQDHMTKLGSHDGANRLIDGAWIYGAE